MDEETPTPRRAARVILLDAGSRVLLIRYQVGDFSFWATPGGAVEPGEQDREAAERELFEELRLRMTLTGPPVHQVTGCFHHEGVFVENTDVFFATRLTEALPTLNAATAFEAECMKEARLWSCKELRDTTENVFPRDLAELIERISPQLFSY